MPIERHLILQELILRPSGEWSPQGRGWIIGRVAEGAAYWLQAGTARDLNIGDGFLTVANANAVLRASQLGILKLQFFTVQPQFLNGLLTVAEWHQLEQARQNPAACVKLFTAAEPLGQKFMRLAAPEHSENLPARCALLQLWTGAVTSLLGTPASVPVSGNKLRERFRQIIGQMPERELADKSLTELAERLNCSERHFSRLFREEFGISLRAQQIELRLQRAGQLLADSDAKVISVAYESGYRHLGLFNAMFKRRYGVTPSEWRQQQACKKTSSPSRAACSRLAVNIGVIFAALGFLLATPLSAQDGAASGDNEIQARARTALFQKMADMEIQEKLAAHPRTVSTNAGPHFKVEKYLVTGNSLLPMPAIGEIFTNIPGAFGTNVTLNDIRGALTDLQMAYRERGFVTVSVGLPQQKLTNAEVKVKVTEGRLAAINVTGNRWFSSNNVMRALPSLHTNMLLNSHVFQRELDLANASRDRQIYPVIGPGLEPGTSELTLKVKDVFPLHARLELNNTHTPNTPDQRANFNAQYDNLWGIEHQVGLQYSFSHAQIEGKHDYWDSPFDDPQIVNYSGYYRLPLGHTASVQEQIDANPSRFGYNEVTHQFNLPPASGRPELTIYASRSDSDTGVQRGPQNFLSDETATNNSGVVFHPLSITTNSAGQNVTLNEDLGMKLSLPLPKAGDIAATLSAGADFKHYRQSSYNTNENSFEIQYYDQQGVLHVENTAAPQALPSSSTTLNYLPFNVGLNGSVPDDWGTTYFNAQGNFNVLTFLSNDKDVATVSSIHPAHARYVTLQCGADRVQTIYKEWTVKLHADGQWADGALFSNEQYAMGGTAGVRGYQDGQAYGDTGWRVSIEPQTPLVKIGMVDGDTPFWMRAGVFMDYGQLRLLGGNYFAQLASFPNGLVTGSLPNNPTRLKFWGAGWNLIANIGSHLDARFAMAFPLIDPAGRSGFQPRHNMQVYFGVGAQF